MQKILAEKLAARAQVRDGWWVLDHSFGGVWGEAPAGSGAVPREASAVSGGVRGGGGTLSLCLGILFLKDALGGGTLSLTL